MEKTLIIIKPDGVKRKLAGKIIGMIEDKGYTIEEIKMKRLSDVYKRQLLWGSKCN